MLNNLIGEDWKWLHLINSCVSITWMMQTRMSNLSYYGITFSWHNCILSAQTKRNLTLFYNTVNSGTEWSNPLESECLQPWPSFVTIVKVNELTLEVSQTCILWCFDKTVRDHQIEFRVGTIRKQSKKFVFPYTH